MIPPAPQAYPPPPLPAPRGRWRRRPNVPLEPVPYQQLMRGPRRAWWRPLLALALAAAIFAAIALAVMVVSTTALALAGKDPQAVLAMQHGMSWEALLANNLLLAGGIPAVILANWIVHRTRPGFVSSVADRYRWGWFASCLALLLPLYAAYVGIGLWLAPPDHLGMHPQAWALAAVIVTTTVLQCAGEEYAFRVSFLQNVGAWFANPWVALIVPIIPSVALFALAHGSLHPWTLIDLGLFALAAAVLAWRTGGIEASVALHAANNVSLMLITAFVGGFDDGFVDENTTGSWDSAAMTAGMQALSLLLVFWWARRRGVRPTDPAALVPFAPRPRPTIPPAPPGPPLGGPGPWGPPAYGLPRPPDGGSAQAGPGAS